MSDFDRWQTRFSVDHYVFGTEPNTFVTRNAGRIKPGGKVLSVADGEGRNGVWLAGQGFEVTSQDFSPRAQQKARALAAERGVTLTFELSDIRKRNWEEGAYDGVVGIFFQFLYPEARAAVFEAMSRAVRPGGVLLIEGYGPKQLDYATGGPKDLAQLYTPELLRDAFGHFSELEVTAYDAEIEEGPGHSGMSALVDLVGRR